MKKFRITAALAAILALSMVFMASAGALALNHDHDHDDKHQHTYIFVALKRGCFHPIRQAALLFR